MKPWLALQWKACMRASVCACVRARLCVCVCVCVYLSVCLETSGQCSHQHTDWKNDRLTDRQTDRLWTMYSCLLLVLIMYIAHMYVCLQAASAPYGQHWCLCVCVCVWMHVWERESLIEDVCLLLECSWIQTICASVCECDIQVAFRNCIGPCLDQDSRHCDSVQHGGMEKWWTFVVFPWFLTWFIFSQPVNSAN